MSRFDRHLEDAKTWVPGCQKWGYPDEATARLALRELKRSRAGHSRSVANLRNAYWCRPCGLWHHTHLRPLKGKSA
jgi:hypothetical protein